MSAFRYTYVPDYNFTCPDKEQHVQRYNAIVNTQYCDKKTMNNAFGKTLVIAVIASERSGINAHVGLYQLIPLKDSCCS